MPTTKGFTYCKLFNPSALWGKYYSYHYHMDKENGVNRGEITHPDPKHTANKMGSHEWTLAVCPESFPCLSTPRKDGICSPFPINQEVFASFHLGPALLSATSGDNQKVEILTELGGLTVSLGKSIIIIVEVVVIKPAYIFSHYFVYPQYLIHQQLHLSPFYWGT